MSEVECEQIAHRAGFVVSVGNWISPDGTVILGTNYESHHLETIQEYLGEQPEDGTHLKWMNDLVLLGFVRLVFRTTVFFQVGIRGIDGLWSDAPNMVRLREILDKLHGVDIHIFSRSFYVIAFAEDILSQNRKLMQIKEEKDENNQGTTG